MEINYKDPELFKEGDLVIAWEHNYPYFGLGDLFTVLDYSPEYVSYSGALPFTYQAQLTVKYANGEIRSHLAWRFRKV